VKRIIFLAARQKDHARSSVSELLLALKDPRSLSESRNNTLKRKSQESAGSALVPGKRSSETGSRRNSHSGMRNSLQKISEVPEGGNKTRKSGLRSFMGYV
jgi:phototropin